MSLEKISFVIPCYRSEKTIPLVAQSIKETMALRKEYDYEIILVNDSSPDNVFDVICDMAEKDEKIKGIDLSKNFGQHSALMTGFRFVTGDIVVCLDDDGQTPASELFVLVDKLLEGYDVVFAKYSNKKHSLFRNFGSTVNDLMARAMLDKPKELAMMSYFCCRRFIIDEVIKYNNPYPYVSGLLLRSTKKIANVEIHHQDRLEGNSGYTFKKLIGLWINGFTSFSVKPLRIATFLGVVCAAIGFLFGIYVVLNKLFLNPSAPMGYSSIMAVLVFLGGMILMMLGLIGEYIGRIYISLNNSPQAVIRQTVNIGNKDGK